MKWQLKTSDVKGWDRPRRRAHVKGTSNYTPGMHSNRGDALVTRFEMDIRSVCASVAPKGASYVAFSQNLQKKKKVNIHKKNALLTYSKIEIILNEDLIWFKSIKMWY